MYFKALYMQVGSVYARLTIVEPMLRLHPAFDLEPRDAQGGFEAGGEPSVTEHLKSCSESR